MCSRVRRPERLNYPSDIPNDCSPIRVDKSEFPLALVDVALNARDAMPSGGRLSIKCENKSFHARDGPHELSGDFVAFEITTRAAVFPPAFCLRSLIRFLRPRKLRRDWPWPVTSLWLCQSLGRLSCYPKRTAAGCNPSGSICLAAEYRSPSKEAKKPRSRRVDEKRSFWWWKTMRTLRLAVTLLKELGYRTLEATQPHLPEQTRRDSVDLVFSDIVLPGSRRRITC